MTSNPCLPPPISTWLLQFSDAGSSHLTRIQVLHFMQSSYNCLTAAPPAKPDDWCTYNLYYPLIKRSSSHPRFDLALEFFTNRRHETSPYAEGGTSAKYESYSKSGVAAWVPDGGNVVKNFRPRPPGRMGRELELRLGWSKFVRAWWGPVMNSNQSA